MPDEKRPSLLWNRDHRRASAAAFAAQMGLDPDALDRAAEAAWSNLNPQSTPYTTALSVAAVALDAARQGSSHE